MFEFITTPDEAQPTVLVLVETLKKDGYKCNVETALNDDAPLATSILATRNGVPPRLVEVQGQLAYTATLRKMREWLHAKRAFAELIVATGGDEQASGRLLKELNHDGVGLGFVHDDGDFHLAIQPTVPALIVTPDPSITVPTRVKKELRDLVTRFNGGERKDALRDLCEVAERETARLICKAAKKTAIKKSIADVEKMNWNAQIDVLGSANASASGSAVVDNTFRADLHSFRGARNLVDHKVASAAAEAKRQQQFPERMMMGYRLVAEIARIERNL